MGGDVATGAAYSLDPADVQASMNELKEAGIINEIPEKKNSIMVIMLSEEEWKQVTDK